MSLYVIHRACSFLFAPDRIIVIKLGSFYSENAVQDAAKTHSFESAINDFFSSRLGSHTRHSVRPLVRISGVPGDCGCVDDADVTLAAESAMTTSDAWCLSAGR